MFRLENGSRALGQNQYEQLLLLAKGGAAAASPGVISSKRTKGEEWLNIRAFAGRHIPLHGCRSPRNSIN